MAMATVSSTLLGLASIGFPVSVTRRPSMGPLTAMRSRALVAMRGSVPTTLIGVFVMRCGRPR